METEFNLNFFQGPSNKKSSKENDYNYRYGPQYFIICKLHVFYLAVSTVLDPSVCSVSATEMADPILMEELKLMTRATAAKLEESRIEALTSAFRR